LILILSLNVMVAAVCQLAGAAPMAVYTEIEMQKRTGRGRHSEREQRLYTVHLSPAGLNNFRCVVDQRRTGRAVP